MDADRPDPTSSEPPLVSGCSETDPAGRLLSLARGYMASRVFLTAIELDVFGEFASGRRTAEQVATALDTDGRATELLLDALTALGILAQGTGSYELREDMARVLLPDGPDYAGGTLRHALHLWGAWSGLTRALRDGHPASGGWTERMKMDLALAMEEEARVAAPRIAALFEGADLNAMLDLGGGSGAYCIAMTQRFAGLRAVLCDRDDQALDLARTRIEAADLQDRVRIREMDILADDFGGQYDLVFLFSVLCTLSEQHGRRLLKRVREALNPGGRVVIRDHMLDDGKPSPPPTALFSVCMLVAASGGQVYSRSQLKSWLNEAGFEDVHRIPMQDMQLMIGRRARDQV